MILYITAHSYEQQDLGCQKGNWGNSYIFEWLDNLDFYLDIHIFVSILFDTIICEYNSCWTLHCNVKMCKHSGIANIYICISLMVSSLSVTLGTNIN